MLQRSAVLGGLILLLGGALGVTLAIRLGRPLQRLRIVAEAMAAGDLQLRAHVARSDEIGELGRAFDHMAERLQSSVRRAKEGDARARPITDSVADGILTITRTGSWSPAIRPRSTSFACKSIELAGRPVAQPLPDERSDRSGRPSVLRIAGGAAGTGGTGGTRREVQGRRPDGSLLPLELTVSETDVDGLQCTITVVRDITERKVLERELQRLAFRDPLTGLPNRALFVDRLEHALARADRQSGGVAVLSHDRDNFKLVNDSLGHQEGDQLLVEISGRLLATVRMADTAAGLGGDEFAILLDEVSCPEETYQVAERIASSLRAPVDLQGREVFVSASVGIALSSPGDRPDNLLRNADMAMYRAKAGGRARCVLFDACLEVGAVERLELETDLATALTP